MVLGTISSKSLSSYSVVRIQDEAFVWMMPMTLSMAGRLSMDMVCFEREGYHIMLQHLLPVNGALTCVHLE